jgi:hypothetical protein
MRPLLLTLAAGLLLAADSPKDTEPPHVEWARVLVQGVRRDDTTYRHKDTAVQWKGIDGATGYQCHTDCSGLLNALLQRAYGLSDDTLKEWFGTRRPLAKAYYEAIDNRSHFKRIGRVQDVRPGDIIAIKYPADDPENQDHNTGHVMLVVARPQPRRASAPPADGTEQWEVAVIDESRSGHGTTDTRHKEGGGFVPGIGQGVFRLYTKEDGTIAGHSWSTQKRSEYHDQNGRHLVIGRLLVRPMP